MAGAVEFFYPPPCGCYLEQMPPETASQPNRWVMIRFCDMHAAASRKAQELETVTKERDEAFNSMAAMTDTRLWEHAIKRAEAAELQVHAYERALQYVAMMSSSIELEGPNWRDTMIEAMKRVASDALKGTTGEKEECHYGWKPKSKDHDTWCPTCKPKRDTENRVESPKTCANCGGTSPLRPSGLCKSCADSTAEFNALTEKRLGVPNPEPELCIVCERNSVTPPKRICFPCGEAAGR